MTDFVEITLGEMNSFGDFMAYIELCIKKKKVVHFLLKNYDDRRLRVKVAPFMNIEGGILWSSLAVRRESTFCVPSDTDSIAIYNFHGLIRLGACCIGFVRSTLSNFIIFDDAKFYEVIFSMAFVHLLCFL